MGLKLVTPPATDILSIAEAKAWLKLEAADDDALVTGLVAASRCAIESYCGRKLVSQRWIWTIDAWPPHGVLRLPLSPLLSLVAVRVSTAADRTVALAPESVMVDASSDPPRLIVADRPAPGVPVAGIAVEAIVGYGADASAVPDPLRAAARLMLAALYENRGEVPDAVSLPGAAIALVEPYRARRLR
jgi:uncharacterized phiE125 gp8 family phage protein